MPPKSLLKPEPISKDLSDVGFTIPPSEKGVSKIMWLMKWFSRKPKIIEVAPPGYRFISDADYMRLRREHSETEYNHLLQEYNQQRNEVILLGQQVGSLKFNYDQFLALQVEAAQIGKFVETGYRKEVEAGEHARFKTLADMVVYYLARERRYTDHLTEGGRQANVS